MNPIDMDRELRILMLENDSSDAELAARELRKAALRFSLDRVEDRDAFINALQSYRPDLMLIDYNLPSMDGLEALSIARQRRPDVPFIFVSGSIGEELAIDMLQQGATDYVMKARLARLGPAVQRALAEARVRAERRLAQEALRTSEENYRRIVETANEGVTVTAPDGPMTFVNERWAEMLGYAREELLGRPILDFVGKEEKAKASEVRAKLRDGAKISMEFKFRRKDGSVLWAITNASPLRDEAGRYYGDLSMHTDITERKKAEAERAHLLESEQNARAEAEASSRAKDAFLALVSHELRTPVTSILGWSWLLRSGELSPRERRSALECIERSMQTEKQIIDELIDVSSMTHGQLSLKKQVLDLGPLVAETAAGFEAEFQAKSLRLVCEPTAGLLIEGDPRRLRQVFGHLVSNAAKFSPEGGTVTVLARREEDRAVVSVEDTGPGISLEFYGKLFGLFGQQEDPLTRAHGGLGLGLAISKHLIDLHGGTVTVAPPVPGQGAKISVTLPLAAVPPAGPIPGLEAEASPHFPELLRDVRVLVVEDDDDTRDMLLSVLAHCGARAQGAASAAEGFAAFVRAKPEVLIFDIAMPGEDGISLLHRIRALRPQEGGEVPAAALTAYATAEDRAKALRAGFQIYLPKPVDPSELLTVVRALTRKPVSRP